MVQVSIRQVEVDTDLDMKDKKILKVDNVYLSSADNTKERILSLDNDGNIRVDGTGLLTPELKLHPSVLSGGTLSMFSGITGTPGYALVIAPSGTGMQLSAAGVGGGISGISTRFDNTLVGASGNITDLDFVSDVAVIDPTNTTTTTKVPIYTFIQGGGVGSYQPVRKINLTSGLAASYNPGDKSIDLSATGSGGGMSSTLTEDIISGSYKIKKGSSGAFITLGNDALGLGTNASVGTTYQFSTEAPGAIDDIMSVTTMSGVPTVGFKSLDTLFSGISGHGNNKVLQTNGSGALVWGTVAGGGSAVSSLNSLSGALTINSGTGISVTPSGSTIQIANTGVTQIVTNADNTGSKQYSLVYQGAPAAGSVKIRRIAAGDGISITKSSDGGNELLTFYGVSNTNNRNAQQNSSVGVGVFNKATGIYADFMNIRAGANTTVTRTNSNGVPDPTAGEYITIASTYTGAEGALEMGNTYALTGGDIGLTFTLTGDDTMLTATTINSSATIANYVLGNPSGGTRKGTAFAAETTIHGFFADTNEKGFVSTDSKYGSYHIGDEISHYVEGSDKGGIVFKNARNPIQIVPQYVTDYSQIYPPLIDPYEPAAQGWPGGTVVGTYSGAINLVDFPVGVCDTMPSGGLGLCILADGYWYVLPINSQTYPNSGTHTSPFKVLRFIDPSL